MSKEDNFRSLILTTNSDESIVDQLDRLFGWKLEKKERSNSYRLSQGTNEIHLSDCKGYVQITNVHPQDFNNERAIPLKDDILFKLHEDINAALNSGIINVRSTIDISDNDIEKLNQPTVL
jgi:hypothetical protein